MPRVCGRLLFVAIVAGAAWTALPGSRTTGVALSAAETPFATKGLQWQGVGSCSSMACHHMNGPKGSKGSEYSTWVSYDPHRKAYTALFDDRSKIIEKNLKKLATLEEAKPEANALCLKCHATGVAQEAKRGPRFDLLDGVGCESCHGPAEKWLTKHYSGAWQSLTVEQKAAEGMRPTKNLLERALVCTECHVGAADREVNHDLIAAGHPRLNFEFGAFLANEAKHWQEKNENARNDFEARVWAVGQVASLQAAMELLEARAKAAMKEPDSKAAPGERAVWPEFSEYDCFACHHGLRDEKFRRERDFTKRKPGSYPWATWYQVMTPALVKHCPGGDAEQAVKEVDELSSLMSFVRPDPTKVAAKAEAARKLLAAWAKALDGKQLTPDQVNALVTALASDQDKLAGASWDSSAQVYLALAALHQARKATNPQTANDGPVIGQLTKLFNLLDFQPGYSSPTGFKANEFRDEVTNLQKLIRE